MKRILESVNIVIITIILLLSTFLIGTPINDSNVYIVYIISGIYSVIYFVTIIIKKEKIITNRLDIFLCILTFATLVPLVFKTYLSLTETVHMVLKYFCLLSLYFISKSECKKNTKNVEIILNIIIISVCILCIIGIDEINQNYFEKFKEKIGFNNINYDEKRIGSLFSYPNTMAAVIGVGIFITLRQILKNSKIINKVIYTISLLLMIITMILTYSRLVYIMFGILIIVYFFIIAKKYNINKMINKKLIIIVLAILILVTTYILFALQIPKKVIVKNNYQKILYSVEPNSDYIFKFKIDTNSYGRIKITEKNKYFDDIRVTEREIESNIDKNIKDKFVEISIKTSDTTSVIYINIENLKEDGTDFIINDAYLNNQKFILKYKLLPTGLVDKINSINLKNKSAWERLIFITDAIEATKENFIFGLGGNAWRAIQYKVQDYNYYAQEVHCYPVQILLETGILGLIACIAIFIWIIINFTLELKNKNINIQDISIYFAILFIILHSLLDFNLSYFYVLLICNLLMAIVSCRKEEIKSKNNNLLFIIMILFSLVNIEVSAVEKYYNENTSVIVVNEERTEQKIFETYYKLLPFNKNVKQKRYEAIMNTENVDYQKLKKILIDMVHTEKYDYLNLKLQNIVRYIYPFITTNNINDEDIKIFLEYLRDTRKLLKYQPKILIERWENLQGISNILRENGYPKYAETINNEIYIEINEKKQYLLDIEKSRYPKNEFYKYKEIINNIKDNVSK